MPLFEPACRNLNEPLAPPAYLSKLFRITYYFSPPLLFVFSQWVHFGGFFLRLLSAIMNLTFTVFLLILAPVLTFRYQDPSFSPTTILSDTACPSFFPFVFDSGSATEGTLENLYPSSFRFDILMEPLISPVAILLNDPILGTP